MIPAESGGILVLGPSDLNVYEYDWSPDGRQFVVTAAHGSGDDNWWVAELDLNGLKQWRSAHTGKAAAPNRVIALVRGRDIA